MTEKEAIDFCKNNPEFEFKSMASIAACLSFMRDSLNAIATLLFLKNISCASKR